MRTTLILLLPLLAAACSPGDDGGFSYKGDLTDLGPAPDFHLLERSGKPLDRKDLDGRVWLATFIFSRCQKECGQIGMEMAQLQEEFAGDPDFRMLSVTVDPAYDKPDVLKAFARSWDADPERWLFAWGRAEDIKALMGTEGFKVGWEDQMVNHSLRFTLVDRKGRMRGSYMANDLGRMEKMRKDIRTLLAQRP